ncbi:MAG: NAD-dependent epimerase/dehydratase family protein [Deltaproteobacteria bacterium]|nr:NAD-dependent epimerase/dehydratase family protein [Deltaproteobacteria bacterium]
MTMSAKEAGRAFPGPVAVSGAAGRLGHLVVRRLHRTDEVLALDPRDFAARPADVTHHMTDLRRRATRDIFRRGLVGAAVHLGPFHSAGGEGKEQGFAAAALSFSRLLEYCDAYHVKKLVLLSSADVYGASATNPQFLSEEAPLLAADLSALRDVDMMAQSFFWKRPDIETVILRPCHIVGHVAGAMARYLRLAPVPVLLGYDPMIQLLHEEDAVRALRLALAPGVRGIFNVAGPPPMPLSRVLERLRRRVVRVPHVLASPVIKELGRIGKTALKPAYVSYIRYVCMVDDSRAREKLGYAPSRGFDETIAAVDLWE